MEMPRLRRGFGITLLLVYALYCVLNAIYGSQGSSDMSSADNDTSVVQASGEAENALLLCAAAPMTHVPS